MFGEKCNTRIEKYVSIKVEFINYGMLSGAWYCQLASYVNTVSDVSTKTYLCIYYSHISFSPVQCPHNLPDRRMRQDCDSPVFETSSLRRMFYCRTTKSSNGPTVHELRGNKNVLNSSQVLEITEIISLHENEQMASTQKILVE